jgi:hypothetical protein
MCLQTSFEFGCNGDELTLATPPVYVADSYPLPEVSIPIYFKTCSFQFLDYQRAYRRTFGLFFARVNWAESQAQATAVNCSRQILTMIETIASDPPFVGMRLIRVAHIIITITLCVSGILKRDEASLVQCAKHSIQLVAVL